MYIGILQMKLNITQDDENRRGLQQRFETEQSRDRYMGFGVSDVRVIPTV
jgi:hypothetical protein